MPKSIAAPAPARTNNFLFATGAHLLAHMRCHNSHKFAKLDRVRIACLSASD
jgi:hypothetical protein